METQIYECEDVFVAFSLYVLEKGTRGPLPTPLSYKAGEIMGGLMNSDSEEADKEKEERAGCDLKLNHFYNSPPQKNKNKDPDLKRQ